MKRFLISLLCLASVSASFAQEVVFDNGTTKVYANGFVYSKGGFVEKATRLGNYTTNGIYSADGAVLVQIRSWIQVSHLSVSPETKVIANNAFQRVCSSTDGAGIIYIPSSVEYIAPGALECGFYRSDLQTVSPAIYISDDITDVTSSAKESVMVDETVAEAKEVARYNIQGAKLEGESEGINIIKMSDNTAKKVMH